MNYHLAVMVYSELKEAPPSPVVQGFIDRLDPLFGVSREHEGFVAQSYDQVRDQLHLPPDQWDIGPWGPQDQPYWYDGPIGKGQLSAKALSVWTDVASVRRYAFQSGHREALQKRREWLKTLDTPTHVAWWIPAGTYPSYAEGCRRIEHLHEHGPTEYAFDLMHPFEPSEA